MPIRINLLAEQHAAEEARRRDPVKRAIFICSGLVAVMLLWGLSLHLNVRSARKELAGYEARLVTIEDRAKQAKADKQLDAEITKRLASLERYRNSRFFWGNVMNGMQHIVVDNVRFMEFNSDQKYLANPEAKVKTNIVFSIPAPKSAWKFWAKAPPSTNVLTMVTNLVIGITNRPPFSTNKVPLVVKITELTTNTVTYEVTAKLEFTTPPTSVEDITTLIDARDYSVNPPGNQVEELRRTIAREPFFKEALVKTEGEGIRLKDRLFKPENDPMDAVNPAANFIRFQLECAFEKRVLANE